MEKSFGRSWEEIAQGELQFEENLTSGSGNLHPISVYTASKLHHAPLWRRLAIAWPEIHFTARWPTNFVGPEGRPLYPEDSPAHAQVFWQQDLQDIENSNVLLCYAEGSDVLRGALVEVGVALALSRHVIVVGENDCYGTWQFHRNVLRVKDLPAARNLLQLLSS